MANAGAGSEAERKYRESEKKIHMTPYVDPGEAAVDLPQDIIRQGGDLILLKRPVTWSYPDHPDYTGKWPAHGGPPGGAGGLGGGGHHYAAGGAGDYGGGFGAGYGGGGGGGVGGPYGTMGGGGGGGGGGGYRGGSVGAAGGVGGGGGSSSGYHRGGAGSEAGGGGGYYSGVNSIGGVGGGAYANSDYAAAAGGVGAQGREYPVSIKRSASHGDSTSSSAFTPAISSEGYPGGGGGGGLGGGLGGGSSNYNQVQKYAGLNAFPVSPADARLSPWGAGQPLGSPAPSGGPGSATTTTTSYKRLYQEQTSKRMTSNGTVTMDEYQRKQNKESGQYYS